MVDLFSPKSRGGSSVVLLPMDAELGLETDWSQHPVRCDFLADVIVYDPLQVRHLVRTGIARKFLTLEGHLDTDAVAVTVLEGKVAPGQYGPHVSVQSSSFVLSHGIPSSDNMLDAIELCSGLGALGEGLEHNGFTVRVRNDIRKAYTQLMYRQGFSSSVVGDIGSNETIALIHKQHPGSSMHAAGFPCQPWSPLGDRKCNADSRGRTLNSILRAAYMLRAHSVLLECVTGAKQDAYIMRLLYRWCKITGYNAREVTLNLHTVWPAKRTRWWVLLSFGGHHHLIWNRCHHCTPCHALLTFCMPSQNGTVRKPVN